MAFMVEKAQFYICLTKYVYILVYTQFSLVANQSIKTLKM